MPGMFQKVKDFMSSPQGRKAQERAKQFASDPKNRSKAQQMLKRFTGGSKR